MMVSKWLECGHLFEKKNYKREWHIKKCNPLWSRIKDEVVISLLCIFYYDIIPKNVKFFMVSIFPLCRYLTVLFQSQGNTSQMCFLTVNLSRFKLEWLIARELYTFMSHSSFQSQMQDTKHDHQLLFLGWEAFLEQQWQEYLMKWHCKNRLVYWIFSFPPIHFFPLLFLFHICFFSLKHSWLS